jgi:hypothetical protein
VPNARSRVLSHRRILVGHTGEQIVVVDLQPAEHEEAEAERQAHPAYLRLAEARDRELVRLPGGGEVHDGHAEDGERVRGDHPTPAVQVDPGPEEERAAEREQRLRQDQDREHGLRHLEEELGLGIERVARHDE